MWILPAWAAFVPVQYLIFGTAAGQPPAPPMVSGPIVAVIAAGALLVERQRFAVASEVPSTVATASGTAWELGRLSGSPPGWSVLFEPENWSRRRDSNPLTLSLGSRQSAS